MHYGEGGIAPEPKREIFPPEDDDIGSDAVEIWTDVGSTFRVKFVRCEYSSSRRRLLLVAAFQPRNFGFQPELAPMSPVKYPVSLRTVTAETVHNVL